MGNSTQAPASCHPHFLDFDPEACLNWWIASGSLAGYDVSRLANTLRSQADLLEPATDSMPMHGCFRRAGDAWLLTWHGKVACVRHTAGMDIIRFLLDHPGEAYTPADIEAIVRGHKVAISTAASLPSPHERAELRKQLNQLSAWRESVADGHEDLPMIDKTISELRRQMRGGWSDEYEAARARIAGNVTHAIRRIEQHLPALAVFLRESIAVSASGCAYKPDSCCTFR